MSIVYLLALDIEAREDVARGGGDGDHHLLRHPPLLQVPDKHPVVNIELVLLQEALGGGVLGLDSAHELVELSPLLPHCP